MNVDVNGTAIWGHGPTRYAVYKIDIRYKDTAYTIYRRYKEFDQLHQTLTQSNPSKMAALQSLFPERGNMGSLVNSFEPVVTDRMHAFHRYLQALVNLEGVLTLQIVQSFFDINGQGTSGFRKAVGGTNILKETYLEFSWATLDFMSLKIWAPHYVGLTKRGYLYVFSTIYDDISSAVVTIDLRTIDVRVTGDVSSLVIGISNPTVKFYLKYASLDEFSSWLRQVSDFGVNAASQTVPSKAAERLVSSDKRPANAVGGTGAVRNSRRQQPGGTGVANDEFSDMFGM